LSNNHRIVGRRAGGRGWRIDEPCRECVSDRAHCNCARIRVLDRDRVAVLRSGRRRRAVSTLGGYEPFHSLRRNCRHVRVCGGAASGDGEIPTDPGPIVQGFCAAAGIRERRVRTDRTPKVIEEALEIIVAAYRWDPLFDLTGGRVVLIHRATYRLAGVAEAFGETEAGIRPPQERIPGAIEDTAGRGETAISDLDFGVVVLISNNVRVGLLDYEPRRADGYKGHNFVWSNSCAQAGNRGLADRCEHRPLSDAVRGGRAVRVKIGRVEDSAHGDERAAIAGNCVTRVELMIRSVRDVLDLATQLVAQPDVAKRTCRGDICKWSVRGCVGYSDIPCRVRDGAGIAHRDQAPRGADRACNQRNGCTRHQFRC